MEQKCWWFGINNARKMKRNSHVIYSQIQPLLSGKQGEFEWPYNKQAKRFYEQMRPGDKVVFWMGDRGSYTDWGILGFGFINDVRGTHLDSSQYILKVTYVPSHPITPYPSGKPQETEETQFLKDIFGLEFKPLGKTFDNLGYGTARAIATIAKIEVEQFEALYNRARNSRNAVLPFEAGRECVGQEHHIVSHDENEIRRIIYSLLPQEKKRDLCLKIFVENINHANSYGSYKWGVHYDHKKVRLLMGSLIVCTIEQDCIWLALDRELLTGLEKYQQLLEKANSWQWDETDYPTYKIVSSRNGYYIPSENHLEIWPIIKLLHFEFINKVANKFGALKTTSQLKHSLALLNYLRNAVKQFIPNPAYEQMAAENNFTLPEEVLDDVSFYEGSKQRITVNAYERNAKARKICIAHYGACCQVCNLDFGKRYGEVGKGFIHVHHIKPLSDIKEEYKINPTQDLIPVCPNCHAIIHKKKPPYTIEEVKRFINSFYSC